MEGRKVGEESEKSWGRVGEKSIDIRFRVKRNGRRTKDHHKQTRNNSQLGGMRSAENWCGLENGKSCFCIFKRSIYVYVSMIILSIIVGDRLMNFIPSEWEAKHLLSDFRTK